jgi:hypothetical protein
MLTAPSFQFPDGLHDELATAIQKPGIGRVPDVLFHRRRVHEVRPVAHLLGGDELLADDALNRRDAHSGAHSAPLDLRP